jgi:hypothetical protein
MKIFSCLIVILCLFSCQRNQVESKQEFKKAETLLSRIDSLDSESVITRFIYEIDFKKYGNKTNLDKPPFQKYKLKTLQSFPVDNEMTRAGIALADSLKIDKSYYKADFDNNGFNDLLVIGNFDDNDIMYNYVLMNYGKDSINIKESNAYRHAFTVPKIILKENKPFLQVTYPDMIDPFRTRKIVTRSKLLNYNYGGFIEVNESPKDYRIEKFEFQSNGCMGGSCPVFNMIIYADKSIIFRPEFNIRMDNSEKQTQTLRTKLSDEKYNQIISLLNYMNFPVLETYYAELASDGQSANIIITYANGKVKTIEDNAYPATYGLRRLYEIIFELRNNQKWIDTAGNKG